MSEWVLDYVVRDSPYGGAEYVAHIALAYHADDDATVRCAQPVLARTARLHLRTFRQTVRSMIDAGVIEVIEQPVSRTPALLRLVGVPARPAQAKRHRKRASVPQAKSTPECVDAAGESALSGERTTSLDLSLPSVESAAAAARRVAQAAWTRTPRPAQPFIAIVKVAEALIDAGWSESDVTAAVMVVPTISTRWCEAELNRTRTPSTRTQAPVDTERSGPAVERIKL